MENLLEVLKSILSCEIEWVERPKTNILETQTYIGKLAYKGLLVHAKLSETEIKLIEKLLEARTEEEGVSAQDLLLNPQGHLYDKVAQSYPLRLWRVLYKDSQTEVRLILKSTFRRDRILHMSDNESVVLTGNSDISPIELLSILESEALTRVKIVVGRWIDQASELYAAYIESDALLELGKLLKIQEQVFEYETLKIPLFIRQMDFDREHLAQYFKPMGDIELEQTALSFLSNNLNITETANKLFIHRNTLIYRLNKLESITGYDIRKFNDAINYYLSYLVSQIK
ncbi:PucR family transcriptional regulator [Fusibacter tunisiensis]|uniref:PucR C-terminal helix-turn-helix domain-containing protein n=1 Tax=Fusibacter tunisiensis TaxID=1008308 RepID=A0ABS2MT50_9FIRM|nr:helix-turn-helix domain-containing protein [Fusibacter tunisiensis]MBM7562596.1 hypothetical protein [Fusibacter tunisiensis]